MQFQVPIDIKPFQPAIQYTHRLLLMGSCFTEHIGNYLQDVKFNLLQNPNGILFDPISVCNSLISYIENKQYGPEDIFCFNDGWHSWQHHSRYSGITAEECLQSINQSQLAAHLFLKQTDWLIITLGSSFVYKFSKEMPAHLQVSSKGHAANCHKAPAQFFNKYLLSIEETISALDNTIHRLRQYNPDVKIVFTISPVRHIRDGVVQNNRSKARLLEAVHHLVAKFSGLYYFPAYELVIDVLRDYRFYDVDMVHPNYAATTFVLEHFSNACMSEDSRKLMEEIRKVVIAQKHKPFNPGSEQHKMFLNSFLQKTKHLQEQHPYLDFRNELSYFNAAS